MTKRTHFFINDTTYRAIYQFVIGKYTKYAEKSPEFAKKIKKNIDLRKII